MKFQTTLAFTFLLLLAMFGAGTVSALYGFTVGYEALKGVKQPEGNPSQQLIHSRQPDNGEADPAENLEFVSERSIIVSVYDQIQAQEKELQKATASATPEKNTFIDAAEPPAETGDQKTFPLTTSADDITLEIVSGQLSGNDWLMEVNLQNNGQEAVNFLYNFLEIKTETGRLLSTQMDGLPNEIPANRQKYAGTIRIPAVILDETKSLSLQLQDYPDREISLELSQIPVIR
ncbi:hypothetical protein AWQ21_06625 [Picosynechococcus sp. PCC 7003]|uniref:hypothetical protein n=1 Tax=Picosynechococcus sp. PCC 7003 TaxID=374981 RepID=UPI00081057D0|nr:hypothetical protein [Picosynechococcus sp. PCC 7003]ANV84083.1 hypothetical protein AWQ21_06625 [Picosynechococcus sp. PCC 7003]